MAREKMTEEEAIRVLESWIERDKNMEYADRFENIEIYETAIKALKRQQWLSSHDITCDCQTESLISRYQNEFVSSPTETIKVGEPISNSDEINKALEKSKLYKQGFQDAMNKFKRPHGEWIENKKYNRRGKRFLNCSVCHYGDNGDIVCHVSIVPNFCPNCGADMRTKKEGDKE